MLHIAQLARMLAKKPRAAAPAFTVPPYIGPELYAGDTVITTSGSVTGFLVPTLSAVALTLGGVPVGATYTTVPGDVGTVIGISQSASNNIGSATSNGTSVTVQQLPTFASLGFMGGNVDNAFDGNTNRLLLNAFKEGRSDGAGGVPGSNGYGQYRLPRLGNDILADPVSAPSGLLTLTATSGSLTTPGSPVTVNMGAGAGTNALAGDATDVGRTIYPAYNTSLTITGFVDKLNCTGVLNTACAATTAAGQWSISQPPVILSATSGSGVTLRITTTAMSNIALAGNATDINRRFTFPLGVTALVTGYTDTQHCTVTIQGGTLLSTTVAGRDWYVSPGVDSNGWPLCASTNVFTSSYGYAGVYSEGNLGPSATKPDGVYHCTWISTAGFVPALQGTNCSMTTVVATSNGDGTFTYKADLTVGASKQSTSTGIGTTITFNFNQGYSFADCPRDGSATSVGKSEFNPFALAYYSQFVYLRFMDFMSTNGNISSSWLERVKDYAQARSHYSWEFLVSFIKALSAYPGSKFTKAHICTPPFAETDYAVSLANLFNTLNFPSSVLLFWERSNEQWNSGFKSFYYDRNRSYAELQAISSPKYGAGAPGIASIVGNGSSVTVTMQAPTLPAWITVGAAFITSNLSDTSWNVVNTAVPAVVTAVTANSFTYASTKNASVDVTNVAVAYYFSWVDPAGSMSLIADGNLNLYQTYAHWHARSQYANWQAVKAIRPQDRFLISSQYGNGNSTPNVNFSAFLNGAAVGSYISLTGSGYVDGTYSNVAMTNVSAGGSGATATVTVSGGKVVALNVTNFGTGYFARDRVSIAASSLGGSGSGFIAIFSGNDATWAYGLVVAPYIQPTALKPLTTITLGGTAANTDVSLALGAATQFVLYGDARDNGRYIYLPNNGNSSVNALIKAYGDTTHCTVTIGGTAAASVNVPSGSWTMDYTLDDLMTVFAATATGMIPNIQSHIYFAKSHGLHPMAYEGGPDFTYIVNHALVYQAVRDARLGATTLQMWKAFLQLGGEDWAHYLVSPVSFGFWAALENFEDTTSPKLVGVLQAGATGKSYIETPVADGSNLWASPGGTINATTGVRYAYDCTVARKYTELVSFNRTRKYLVSIEGTSDTTGIQVTLSIDGVTIGSPMTIPRNGSPASANNYAATASVDPFVAELPSGAHLLDINFPGQAGGGYSGYSRVTFTPA